MNLDLLVDAFADKVGAKPTSGIDWVSELETKLGRNLPPSFKSLLSRYEFEPFECGGVLFFGNSRRVDDAREEMRYVIFRDKVLSDCLLSNGYIQIGRPDTGDYDAICFDLNRLDSRQECPLVRVEHENILIEQKIVVTQVLASSFPAFMQKALG